MTCTVTMHNLDFFFCRGMSDLQEDDRVKGEAICNTRKTEETGTIAEAKGKF